jgi:hypothetical protein
VCGENVRGCGEKLKTVAKTVNWVAKKNKFFAEAQFLSRAADGSLARVLLSQCQL